MESYRVLDEPISDQYLALELRDLMQPADGGA